MGIRFQCSWAERGFPQNVMSAHFRHLQQNAKVSRMWNRKFNHLTSCCYPCDLLPHYSQLFLCLWILLGMCPCPGPSRPTVNESNNHKPAAAPENPLRLEAPHYLVSVRTWLQIPRGHEIIWGLSLEHMASHRGARGAGGQGRGRGGGDDDGRDGDIPAKRSQQKVSPLKYFSPRLSTTKI